MVSRAEAREYLVSHGGSGGFGRFVAPPSLVLLRGQRVLLRTAGGLDVGGVLCPATAGHLALLIAPPEGEILRPLTADDERILEQLRQLGDQLFARLRQAAQELNLPLEILDVTLLMDGRRALVHYLAQGAVDLDSLAAQLPDGPLLFFENLATPTPPAEERHGGCGKPGCGHAEGGCSSCGTDSGCGSCGSGPVDLQPYFAQLREKQEDRKRLSLL